MQQKISRDISSYTFENRVSTQPQSRNSFQKANRFAQECLKDIASPIALSERQSLIKVNFFLHSFSSFFFFVLNLFLPSCRQRLLLFLQNLFLHTPIFWLPLLLILFFVLLTLILVFLLFIVLCFVCFFFLCFSSVFPLFFLTERLFYRSKC